METVNGSIEISKEEWMKRKLTNFGYMASLVDVLLLDLPLVGSFLVQIDGVAHGLQRDSQLDLAAALLVPSLERERDADEHQQHADRGE